MIKHTPLFCTSQAKNVSKFDNTLYTNLYVLLCRGPDSTFNSKRLMRCKKRFLASILLVTNSMMYQQQQCQYTFHFLKFVISKIFYRLFAPFAMTLNFSQFNLLYIVDCITWHKNMFRKLQKENLDLKKMIRSRSNTWWEKPINAKFFWNFV